MIYEQEIERHGLEIVADGACYAFEEFCERIPLEFIPEGEECHIVILTDETYNKLLAQLLLPYLEKEE